MSHRFKDINLNKLTKSELIEYIKTLRDVFSNTRKREMFTNTCDTYCRIEIVTKKEVYGLERFFEKYSMHHNLELMKNMLIEHIKTNEED